jgi:hypothetical protein
MLFSRRCCTKAINFVYVTQLNNLKSYIGSLQHGNFVLIGSKPFSKSYSHFVNLNSRGCNSILMSQVQNYLKKSIPSNRLGITSMSTRTLKTKGSVSSEPQGIHENVSALQMRTRLQRRKRPSMEEEDSSKLGVW